MVNLCCCPIINAIDKMRHYPPLLPGKSIIFVTHFDQSRPPHENVFPFGLVLLLLF